MRYGLLALSLAMLTSGGLAAQSALAISRSAAVTVPAGPHANTEPSGSYGSLSYTAARTDSLRLAAR